MRRCISASGLALGSVLCAAQPLAAKVAEAQQAVEAQEVVQEEALEPVGAQPVTEPLPSSDEAALDPAVAPQPPPVLEPAVLETGAELEFEGVYQPTDELERSLWMEMDEYERTLKTSQQVIREEELNTYIRGVLCRTVGPECANIRLYVLRSPQFNATMAPNGMMTVWSGLLLRTQNEAQLAAVLGHEFSHFQRRHGLQTFRKIKNKTTAAGWLSFIPIIGTLASFELLGSIFSFSREQEQEADYDGVDLIHKAGYDVRQVPRIWAQLLDERDATLMARFGKVKKRKKKAGLFATHPTSQTRVDYLEERISDYDGSYGEVGAESYQKAMRKWWPLFLDDQIKINDMGGTGFLIEAMGKANGWTPWITYARAEYHRRRGAGGDFDAAIGYYTQAIDAGGDLPQLWRGRGMALRKAGRKDEAKPDFREYLNRVPDAPDRAMINMLAGGVS